MVPHDKLLRGIKAMSRLKTTLKRLPVPLKIFLRNTADNIIFFARLPGFFAELRKFKRQSKKLKDNEFKWGGLYPCLNEKQSDGGTISKVFARV